MGMFIRKNKLCYLNNEWERFYEAIPIPIGHLSCDQFSENIFH